jgi:rhodanese-related sulfurtransferase
MMKVNLIATSLLTVGLTLSGALALADKPVGITSKMMEVEVVHNGKKVKITRNQNTKNLVNPSFSKTSRPCPPFCIQPASVAPGVETIGELEMIEYLQKIAAGDDSILVIDSRTPDWVKKGTIPGSVNIPWTTLSPARGADPISIGDILQEQFNVKESEGLWNFEDAKTLVMFCNGMWCGQSPQNIKTLLKFGYPTHKLKWYRGGMQDWEILGLSVIAGN